jgi:serine/threonine protein kinase HipA of HipAB toxin-antitoxin module
MSRRINVNPDHYKVAGRERQGENIVHEVERREADRLRRNDRRGYSGPNASRKGPRAGQREAAGRR